MAVRLLAWCGGGLHPLMCYMRHGRLAWLLCWMQYVDSSCVLLQDWGWYASQYIVHS